MSRIRKHSLLAIIAVMGSRVMGLVRETVFAFFFGAGPHMDAFIAAFRIPNMLRDLFSEGALSNAFITVFISTQQKEGREQAYRLARQVLTFILVVMGLIVILGIIYSPNLVQTVASGFTGQKFEAAVHLNRILFPFILFVSIAAIFMGMLNSQGKFLLPQSASTFFNASSVVAGLLGAHWMVPGFVPDTWAFVHGSGPRPQFSWHEMLLATEGMAWGTLIGGLVQGLVQWPQLRQLGFRFWFSFDWKNPAFVRVLKLVVPAVIGGAAVQVNVLVNTNFASYLVDGSISWLNYAFRLMQFPIGVFGAAVAIATTPEVARLLASDDKPGALQALNESTRLILTLCIPSALGLACFAQPIITLIYQYGQFSSADTLQAAYALRAYSVGLICYALVKVYQPAFLAHNDARSPMLISLLSILINFGVNWLLVFNFNFAHWGLALGTSAVAFFNALLLVLVMRRKGVLLWQKAMISFSLKQVAFSLIAVALGFVFYERFLLQHFGDAVVDRFILVFVPILLVALIYGLLAGLFRKKV